MRLLNTLATLSATPRSVPRPPLWLLIALAALGPFTLNVIMPMMPALAEQFAADYAFVQLVLTVYLATTAVATLALGALSDRFGRRPVVLVSLIVFMVGCALAAVATSVLQLVVARVLQAIGGTAGLVLSRTILYDLHGRSRAASLIGYVTMAMVVAPMLAPVIGGALIQTIDWRWLFIVLGATAGLLLTVCWSRLGETRGCAPDGMEHAAAPFSWKAVGELVRMPRFWGLTATLSFASGVFFAFLSGAPYVVVTLQGQAETVYGIWFIVVSSGYMLGNFITGRLSERVGPDRMIAAGCTLGLFGALMLWPLAGIDAPVGIFGPMAIVAISNGMTLPNVIASTMALSPRLAGTASGLGGAIQLGVGALAATLVGALLDDSASPLRWVMTGCAVASAAAFWLTRRGTVRATAQAS